MVETDLEQRVFDQAVRLYLKTAKPVGSKLLSRRYFHNISSSLLRLILARLVNKGLLENVNFSVGRRPTDRGWHFYLARHLIDYHKVAESTQTDSIFEYIKESSRRTRAYWLVLGQNYIFEAGFSYLLREPEFCEQQLVIGFADFLEQLKSDIPDFCDALEPDKNYVFIGEEIPFAKSNRFFLMLRKKNRLKFIISGIKRTDYPKNYSLLSLVDQFIQ
jgi:transcriptional regulator of heat shock response